MRTSLLLLINILLIVGSKAAKSQDIIGTRNLFYLAAESSEASDSLFKKLETVPNSDNAFYDAYKGMSQLMVCHHSINPYTKFKYFIKGKESLEIAIKKDSINIEYRFLRLCVQLNTPGFLNYQSEINQDKIAIFEGIKTLDDTDLLIRISNYTKNAKKLTTEEKETVQKALFRNKNYII